MPNDTQTTEGAASVRSFLAIVRREILLVLACALITGVAAWAIAHHRPTKYSASASLLVQPRDPTTALPGVVPPFIDPVRARATDIQLITSHQVGDSVAKSMHMPVGKLLGMITATSSGDSDLVVITAKAENAALAVHVANGFANAYLDFRRTAGRNRYAEAISVARQNLAKQRAGHASRATIRVVRNQVLRLRLLSELATADANLITPASRNAVGVVKPRAARIGAAGFLIGLFIGLLLAWLRERLDDRVRDEEVVLDLLGGPPVLALVPRGRGGTARRSMVEAFHQLRANVDVRVPPGPRRSILVTSARDLDGKTTTAANLALAMVESSSGDSVLLVDGDLRHPTLSERLGAASSGTNALPGVLETGRDLEKAVSEASARSKTIGRSSIVFDGSISLLRGGRPKANPAALLTEHSTSVLLEDAGSRAQTVVFDGPPLGMFADMLPLARKVDGLIVVVRLGHTRVRDLRRLAHRLETANLTPTGVVIMGAPPNRSSY